ncbi:hypothetical protein D9K79_12755 [Acinetobacter cumulans]|uniref:DUF4435 domain-containing protein n=1 Tax=Acinetobacter cumulans TaxID=2136182 RepID=A0ABX9U3S5_9GAMM|nr:hypothetical protein [Acinetobacter cumulans]RLL41592.1 hypothetical protein D9K79_12755 [Acinetobacter cumulans]
MKKAKRQQVIFIAEGATERALVKKFFEGTVKEINLAQRDIQRLLKPIPVKAHIHLMIDIDILADKICLNRMLENIKTLKKLGYNFSILQQNKNLEDELARACNCSLKALLKYADCSSPSELKGNFIKNPTCVFSHPEFNHTRLWTTALIPELENYEAHQLTGNDLSILEDIDKQK